MAVDKFSVEGSHIMMFARSIADDNQIYYDADYAKTTEAGGLLRPRRLLNRLLNLTRTIFSDPRSAKTGSAQERSHQYQEKEYPAAGRRRWLAREQILNTPYVPVMC